MLDNPEVLLRVPKESKREHNIASRGRQSKLNGAHKIPLMSPLYNLIRNLAVDYNIGGILQCIFVCVLRLFEMTASG